MKIRGTSASSACKDGQLKTECSVHFFGLLQNIPACKVYCHLVQVHVEVVQAVLVNVVGGEGPAVLPLHPKLLRWGVEAEENIHRGDTWNDDLTVQQIRSTVYNENNKVNEIAEGEIAVDRWMDFLSLELKINHLAWDPCISECSKTWTPAWEGGVSGMYCTGLKYNERLNKDPPD